MIITGLFHKDIVKIKSEEYMKSFFKYLIANTYMKGKMMGLYSSQLTAMAEKLTQNQWIC
jgi:hypothetical protein